MPFSAIISSIDSRKSRLGSRDVFTTAKLSARGGGLVRAGERGVAAGGLHFLDDAMRGVFARVLRRRADDTDRLGLSLLCSGGGGGVRWVACFRTSMCLSSSFSQPSGSLPAGLVVIGGSVFSGLLLVRRSMMISVAEDEVPRPRRVVVGRPVREPRAAVAVPRRARERPRRGPARAGRRGSGAAPRAHVPELEEPRVRDHVGQPELVPPHGWLAGCCNLTEECRMTARETASAFTVLLLFAGLLFLLACSVRGAEAQGRRWRGRGEQKWGGAREESEERRGREAPFVLALARRLPPAIPLCGVGPHTGYSRRGKATAGAQTERDGGRSGSRSGQARPKRRRKQAATPCHARTHEGIISFAGVAQSHCTVPLLRIALLIVNLKRTSSCCHAQCDYPLAIDLPM
uniref:Uncharacterized protein n=1 Tax=Setaria italica TaxID=4555 RepID=K3XII3_SETIT